jgi:hypothetical protein
VKRLLAIFALTVLAFSVASAYGHGLGKDQSLPVTISNKQVAVEASMLPTFVGGPDQPTFSVRAFDTSNNATIPNTDFRVTVDLKGETLLDQRFHASDGVVMANLVPDGSVEGWQIDGQEASPEEQVEVSLSDPVELKSKILSAGGLYHVAVTMESASATVFDLYISIGRTFDFDVKTVNGTSTMSVKTYYDDVTAFDYDAANATISFEMPFPWDDRAYVDQVQVVHMEVQFPKSIKELQVNGYRGYINGNELAADAVLIDDYSSQDVRIVHFVLSNAKLSRLAESVEGDTMVFSLTPTEKPKFPIDILSLPTEKYLLQMSWGPEVIETGVPITFVMNIQDPATGDLLRHSSFDFVIEQGGSEVHRKHLTSDLGTYSYQYTFGQAGTVKLSANNINGEGESSEIDLVVLQGSGTAPPTQPSQPSGCLIATAAFGSELTPQVQYLRNFRENYILSTTSGSAFMSAFNSVYYSFSPQVADYERGQPWLQATVKAMLYPLFGILLASEGVHSMMGGEAGAISAGATASSLIGAVYLLPAGMVASKRATGRLLLIIVAGAAAALVITLFALPSLLPVTTSAFVVAAAGASAIASAKAVRIVRRRVSLLAQR